MIGQTNKQTNRDYNYICIDDNDDDNDNDNDNDIIDVANDIKNKNLNFASTALLLMIIRLKITLCDPYLETKYCIIARLKNKQVISKV